MDRFDTPITHFKMSLLGMIYLEKVVLICLPMIVSSLAKVTLNQGGYSRDYSPVFTLGSNW